MEMESKMKCKIHRYFTMHFDLKQLQLKTIWEKEKLDGCNIFSTKRETSHITKTARAMIVTSRLIKGHQ